MAGEDPFGSEETTAVGDTRPTPRQTLTLEAHGEQRFQDGIDYVCGGLRYALVRVGVSAKDVSRIVEHVLGWANWLSAASARTPAKPSRRGAGRPP